MIDAPSRSRSRPLMDFGKEKMGERGMNEKRRDLPCYFCKGLGTEGGGVSKMHVFLGARWEDYEMK